MNKKVILSHLLRIFRYFFFLGILLQSLKADDEYLIYNPCKDSSWFPATYVINGTFDVTQNQNWFNQDDFFQKNEIVWKRVKSPIKSIERDGGFGPFLKDEFLSDRAIPNILLHTLGGAYDGRWLTEYYSYHGVSYSYLLAVTTSYFARWGNEALEVSSDNINNHDHLADLFIFDSFGLWLSTNERFMHFLVKDMGMRAWHSLPFYDPSKENFHNAGLNYIIRPDVLKITQNVSPFFYFGMQNILGISVDRNNNKYSIGTGVFFTDPLKRKLRFVTSFFYERSGELALSSFVNGSEGFKWRINVYPRMFKAFEKLKIGILVGERRDIAQNDYSIGLNVNGPFGLGRY